MKRFKRIASLMLALMMVFAMSATVFAAEQVIGEKTEGTGSIKIENVTKEKTYTVYKVFDATVSGSNIAYKWPEWPEESGIKWEYNEYFEKDSAGNISAKDAAYEGGSEVENGKLSDGAIAWIKDHSKQVAQTVAKEETLVFNNLEYGYYYVDSDIIGAAITVNSVDKDVTFTQKKSIPTWDETPEKDGKVILVQENGETQKVTANDGAFGDTVNYSIGINATNYFGNEKIVEYYITDQLGEGLEYVVSEGKLDGITVMVGTTPLSPASSKETMKSNEYYFEWTGDQGAECNQYHNFKITIPWATGTKEDGYTSIYTPETGKDTVEVHVTYSATIDTDAEIGNTGNENIAKFDFKTEKDEEESGPYHEQEEKKTTTYTYAVGILKTDETGKALANAKFTIGNLGGVETAPNSGIYVYYENESAAKEADAENVYTNEFTTNSSGQIIIKGVDAGSYTVKETEAPAGYNKLTGSVTVEAKKWTETTYSKTHTVYYDENGKVVKEETTDGDSKTVEFPIVVAAITVINTTGTLLPSTGGIGTTIFYVVGAILVIGAGILLVVKKRMSNR